MRKLWVPATDVGESQPHADVAGLESAGIFAQAADGHLYFGSGRFDDFQFGGQAVYFHRYPKVDFLFESSTARGAYGLGKKEFHILLVFWPVPGVTSAGPYLDMRRRMCLDDEPKSCAILWNYFLPRPLRLKPNQHIPGFHRLPDGTPNLGHDTVHRRRHVALHFHGL